MDKAKGNFLVTGWGRSGTLFLATVMDLSKTHTVYHERRGEEDIRRIQPTPTLLQHFSQDNYIEVNSYLRYSLYEVPVDNRGIIIRDTKEIVKSIANRKDVNRTIELIDELHYAYTLFDYWFKNDDELLLIDFEKMTTNKGYLDSILRRFGIYDVDLSSFNIKHKINPNKAVRYTDWMDVPIQIIERYNTYNWNFNYER